MGGSLPIGRSHLDWDCVGGQSENVVHLRPARFYTRGRRAKRRRADVPPDLAPGDYVLISVADTGEGMTQEVRKRAVEPFFTTKEVGKGSGLGLSMVHGVATQSGGALHIESRHGRGTTVGVCLPRAKTGPIMAWEQEARPSAPHARATILVVDEFRSRSPQAG
jgi:signal transduction histidine kinase